MSSGGGLRQRQLPGGVSTIGAVASYGPPDDFNNQPTTQADFGRGGHPPSDEPPPTPIPPDQSKPPEPLDQETEPAAWYRKPVVLIVWALLVLILIGLIVYGLGELIGGGEGTGPAPSTTPTTTTAPSSTTTTTTPPTSTTTPTTPPTSTAVQPPTQQQPTQQQPTQQPTQKPTHHPHLPPLPSVITIPEGPTVTLPRGLP